MHINLNMHLYADDILLYFGNGPQFFNFGILFEYKINW